MGHNLLIFNRRHLDQISEKEILDAINESNLNTLCRQYGLDSKMIEPALSYLDFVTAPDDIAPFFILRYGDVRSQPLIIHRWDASQKPANGFFREGFVKDLLPNVRACLGLTREIFSVGLEQAQLRDMGLVLSHEFARWAVFQGKGILRGLDGRWYRLNRHKAFIPLSTDGD